MHQCQVDARGPAGDRVLVTLGVLNQNQVVLGNQRHYDGIDTASFDGDLGTIWTNHVG